MKRLSKLVLTSGLILPACAAPSIVTSCTIDKTGGYGFMFKMTGNHYGELLYEGFSEYLNKDHIKIKHYDKSPSEANVGEQIQIIETLVLQNVKALTVSAAGTTGYDNVLKKAHEKQIKVVSVDSPISPKYRLVHVDHCDPKLIGRWLAYASILIALRIPYDYIDGHDIPDIEEFGNRVAEACKDYKGEKKKFGHLSSTSDSPSQNEWIKYTNEALKDKRFEKVVDTSEEFEVKYGKDDPTTAKQQAEAFLTQNNVDVIICPTTVSMLSAGQAIKQRMDNGGTHIRMTGIGLPSEMKQYMPTAENIKNDTKDKDGVRSGVEFNFPCPFMTIWNVKTFGELAAYVADMAVKGEYKGKSGEILPKYTASDNVEYELKTVESGEKNTDGTPALKDDGTPATKIVSLKPLTICGENIEKFKHI